MVSLIFTGAFGVGVTGPLEKSSLTRLKPFLLASVCVLMAESGISVHVLLPEAWYCAETFHGKVPDDKRHTK